MVSLHASVASGPLSLFFFFNDPATTEIYTLSLHDALPIWSAEMIASQIAARAEGWNREKGKGWTRLRAWIAARWNARAWIQIRARGQARVLGVKVCKNVKGQAARKRRNS